MTPLTGAPAAARLRIADEVSLPELTLRGLLLGALITVLFTASNVYLGLKVGLTFSSSIPAAVISMAVLRLAGGANILENNMVQTQASAAGTLSSIIFILPGLVMTGHWVGFPFWQTASVCAIGGILGVLYSIPLRRALVVQSPLAYPEGVAAAEILRVGSASPTPDPAAAPGPPAPGLADIVAGGVTGAAFSLIASGFKLFGEGLTWWFAAGGAVFRLGTGFSLALVGAGYLVGIVAGLAMLLGVVLAWGVAVPVLTATTPMPPEATLAGFATRLWSTQVRFIGAGVIGIGAVWTLLVLLRPVAEGMRASFAALRTSRSSGADAIPRTERDMPIHLVGGLSLLLIAPMALIFHRFLAASGPALPAGLHASLVAGAVLFAFAFGFLIAAACGYMAGLVGSSASPISGIGIVAVTLVSLLLLVLPGSGELLASQEGSGLAIALALFTTSVIVAVASISNDNLQDLKTGWLVGATPWRQQVALMVGCVAGALVIPPILDLLYGAYGFAGTLPRAGMDPAQALAAPQATLMSAIAVGIFTHRIDWSMILLGIGIGLVVIGLDALLARRGGLARLPVLAVGIGIYLPPTISVTIVIGAVLGWLIARALQRRAAAAGTDAAPALEHAQRRGVLLASGLIVGESLVGVLLAAIIGASGNQTPLALVGPGFEPAAGWLGLAGFLLVCAAFAGRVLATR
ncbi:putative oligopeptide transporter HI_0561 [Rhodovastum atsumiense]|uniref:Oligopeptide transporter, OPT family n=1 Tax=Rhodovastum atsumiense TaxID=504468 RepID=A0A5M6ILH8_9PROT|nr:oligopeptide transporter, OPT family [Rhodovastum atsumiense]KAA5609123.1 oligopeptide transporter, OPT family [Rhodovastum atsumiense]CAH2603801.1 putative oligopeptide transporter HI_0561 [Rhodovastum atsumiense]